MQLKKVKIRVIIPAFNEQNAVGLVVNEIPKNWVEEVIVVDNGSSDNTYQVALDNGATALRESRKGYGMACLTGMAHIASSDTFPDIVVFLDGDHSDFPEQLPDLVQPIIDGKADLVIGSRALGQKEKGSMTPQQIFGNWLATTLIRLFYKVSYTDLGPFRAIRYSDLVALNMQDTNYGWTVEMQLKAAKQKLKTLDVPVNYRQRIGVSKVSGTVKGTIMAGYKIIFTIFKYL
jgi:glycosyltransferase involved in cell wall biosynthesis